MNDCENNKSKFENTTGNMRKCLKMSEIIVAVPRSKNVRLGSSEGHAAPILRGVRGALQPRRGRHLGRGRCRGRRRRRGRNEIAVNCGIRREIQRIHMLRYIQV